MHFLGELKRSGISSPCSTPINPAHKRAATPASYALRSVNTRQREEELERWYKQLQTGLTLLPPPANSQLRSSSSLEPAPLINHPPTALGQFFPQQQDQK